jgi:hypothetical protein
MRVQLPYEIIPEGYLSHGTSDTPDAEANIR